MALEIPGLYVRKDKGTAYAFDHIVIKTIKKTARGLSLTLHNPTAYDAHITILAEDAAQAARPLGENAFWDWKNKVNIKAGESLAVDL
ncbi:hypothetical protein D3C73_1511770 [compost metagenome]